MGRTILKVDPKYDRSLDTYLTVAISQAEASAALMSGLHPRNIEVEEHTAAGLLFSGKSTVGVKNRSA